MNSYRFQNNTYINDYDVRHYNNRAKRYSRHHRKQTKSVNRVMIMLSIILFIMVISLSAAKRVTYAKDSNTNMKKQYTSVTIYSGDSIDTIAERTFGIGYSSPNAYIHEICQINNIDRYADLIPGNYLILPYYEVCTP